MTTEMKRRRIALFALFLIPGLGIASWVTRTPAIRDLVGASTAQMGLILLGLSAGSMAGILSSGALVARFGARPVILAGAMGVVASMPVIGVGAMTGQALVVGLGLLIFGAGMGGGEIAMNVEGGQVEAETGRTYLAYLHGFFSLGTVLGAVAGMVFTAIGFSVVAHLLLVGVVALAVALLAIRHLPEATGRTRIPGAAGVPEASQQHPETSSSGASSRGAGRTRVWSDPRLLLVGGIVLAMALAEGTANDWLPLVMVDGHGLDAALGSAVYAVFAVSMTLGRFVGGSSVTRFGHARVLAASAVLGALGIGLVSLVDHQGVAVAAVVLWGLGASLGFPVAISAAGAGGPDQSARIAVVSTIGYLAFLVGPPVLGFAGEAVGLRGALLIPMVLVLLSALLTPAARPRALEHQDDGPVRTLSRTG